jgi:hypothetical protein
MLTELYNRYMHAFPRSKSLVKFTLLERAGHRPGANVSLKGGRVTGAHLRCSSTMLAGIAVLFAVRRGPACVSATSARLTSFVFGCWHEQHGTEGATRALLRVPARVWASVAGRKRCPRLRQ